MSEKGEEKHSFEQKQRELSAYTSESSVEQPIELTASHYNQLNVNNNNNNNQIKKSRSGSIASFTKKSLDSVRKSLQGDIESFKSFNSNNNDYNNDDSNAHNSNAHYSIKQIYGDLDSNEIRLQRTATRRTIISEIENRIVADDNSQEHLAFNDIEKQKKIRGDDVIEDQIVPIQQHGEEFTKIDPELITWQGTKDPEDPRNWDIKLKIYLLGFVSLYALVAPMSSSMLSPAMSEISVDFNIPSPIMQAMVVSIQILAWAFGPLIIAPLSEYDNIGRKLVLDISCWMSLFFNLGCAFSQNTAQMMVCRFIGGLFGCVPMNVCAGVISDMFDAKLRNAALAGYSLVPLLGPVIAPLISGFIVDHMQWRWCFYVLCIFNFAVAASATILFKETYAPTLLKRKANQLKKVTGNENLHTIYEITNGVESTWGRLTQCMVRPVHLLLTHPMVIGLGSFMAFTYGFMYLMIITFPQIFTHQYGYTKSVTGLMYIPMGVGFILGVVFWTFMVGKTYTRLTNRNNGVSKPEFRLPCLIACAIFIPVGLIWFGWSAQYQLHWIMPGIGSAIFAFGLVCVFQTIQNYLIDMNTRFAASSVAAAALFRSLFGFTFPLFARKMYSAMGYGWGNTMCAFIGIALGIPFPIFCYLYGEKLRGWYDAKYEAKQIKREMKSLEKLKEKQSVVV